MVQSRTAQCAFQKPVTNGSYSSIGGNNSFRRRARPNSDRQTPIIAAGISRDPDRFRTTDVRFSALNA
jgi:hypothetical protein